jgi:hypothetical protein
LKLQNGVLKLQNGASKPRWLPPPPRGWHRGTSLPQPASGPPAGR